VLYDDRRLVSWCCWGSRVFHDNWRFVSWRRGGMLSYNGLVRRCRHLHDDCLMGRRFVGWCFMLRLFNDHDGMLLRSLHRMSSGLSSDVLGDCLDHSDMHGLLYLNRVNDLNGLLNFNSVNLLDRLLDDLSVHHCDGYLDVDRLLDFDH
jgi:hypothetical protein